MQLPYVGLSRSSRPTGLLLLLLSFVLLHSSRGPPIAFPISLHLSIFSIFFFLFHSLHHSLPRANHHFCFLHLSHHSHPVYEHFSTSLLTSCDTSCNHFLLDVSLAPGAPSYIYRRWAPDRNKEYIVGPKIPPETVLVLFIYSRVCPLFVSLSLPTENLFALCSSAPAHAVVSGHRRGRGQRIRGATNHSLPRAPYSIWVEERLRSEP